MIFIRTLYTIRCLFNTERRENIKISNQCGPKQKCKTAISQWHFSSMPPCCSNHAVSFVNGIMQSMHATARLARHSLVLIQRSFIHCKMFSSRHLQPHYHHHSAQALRVADEILTIVITYSDAPRCRLHKTYIHKLCCRYQLQIDLVSCLGQVLTYYSNLVPWK